MTEFGEIIVVGKNWAACTPFLSCFIVQTIAIVALVPAPYITAMAIIRTDPSAL